VNRGKSVLEQELVARAAPADAEGSEQKESSVARSVQSNASSNRASGGSGHGSNKRLSAGGGSGRSVSSDKSMHGGCAPPKKRAPIRRRLAQERGLRADMRERQRTRLKAADGNDTHAELDDDDNHADLADSPGGDDERDAEIEDSQ